jgi:hypothetical protein
MKYLTILVFIALLSMLASSLTVSKGKKYCIVNGKMSQCHHFRNEIDE